MTSQLIGTGHFRPPVLGPSKGQSGVLYSGSHCTTHHFDYNTHNPDSHLNSTTRIPSSDPTGLHPRPTGGPFSEGSYLSAWGCSRHILCPNRQGGTRVKQYLITTSWRITTNSARCGISIVMVVIGERHKCITQ